MDGFSEPISNINLFVCLFILIWVGQQNIKTKQTRNCSCFSSSTNCYCPPPTAPKPKTFGLTSSMGYNEKQM